MLQKAGCEEPSSKPSLDLMTLKDSNVLISLPIAWLSVWPHFTLKTKSIMQPTRTVGHDQSAFAVIPQHLDAVAQWFPGLWILAARNSRRPT